MPEEKSTFDQVLELHKKEPDLTQTQIAERLEIDGSTVSRYLKKASDNGSTTKKTKPKKKVKAKASRKKKKKKKSKRGGANRGIAKKVLAQFKKGNTSPTEIAKKVGCSVSYVVNLKKKEGLGKPKKKLTKRSKKLPKKTPKKKTPKRKAKKKAKRKSSTKPSDPTILQGEMRREMRFTLLSVNERWDGKRLIVTTIYKPEAAL